MSPVTTPIDESSQPGDLQSNVGKKSEIHEESRKQVEGGRDGVEFKFSGQEW